MRSSLIIALLALGLALPASHAQETASAKYRVSYNKFSADGSMRVQPAGNGRWTVSLRMSNMLASIDQATVFDASGAGLRPLGSSRHINYPLGSKAITARFDWASKRASWRGDVKPTRTGPVALANGDMDPLLINLALVRDGLQGKSPTYRMAENGRIRAVRYANLGKASVQVGGKPREAIRMFNQNGTKRTVVWVVPGMVLPARILQTETGGDTIDFRMQ